MRFACALVLVQLLQLCLGAVQQLQKAKQDGAAQQQQHSEPMVAIFCPEEAGATNHLPPYFNKYMTADGQWVTDRSRLTSVTSCPLRDKVSILEYCKKVYPAHDITNIVEAGHFIKLTGWSRRDSIGGDVAAQWVKPYRCLEGPFQSDALLVPEHCLFDHVHNQSRCANFDQWNATATEACRARGLSLKSFGMLLPCGIDVFSGVEFVCCPRSGSKVKASRPNSIAIAKEDSKEEYYAEEEEEETYFEEDMRDEDDYAKEEYVETTEAVAVATTAAPAAEESTTKAATTAEQGGDSSLLAASAGQLGPVRDQMEFIQALEKQDEIHRDQVSRVLNDWAHVQDQGEAAEDRKLDFSSKLQQAMEELEKENQEERNKLTESHRQKVIARAAEKKNQAERCYTQALKKNPLNIHRIKKCVENLLRLLHRERQTTLAHFTQLIDTNIDQAKAEAEAVVAHLEDIDARIRTSFQPLKENSVLNAKVLGPMEDFLRSLRTRDGTASPFLLMDRDKEADLLHQLIHQREQEAELVKYTTIPPLAKIIEDDSDAQAEIKVEVHATAIHYDTPGTRHEAELEESLQSEEEKSLKPRLPAKLLPQEPRPQIQLSESADAKASSRPVAADDQLISSHKQKEQQLMAEAQLLDQPSISHAQAHVISHAASYTMRHKAETDYNTLYVAILLGVGLMVLLVVGVALRQRKEFHSHDGFIQVETDGSPEEKLVSTMQMNGYENPTYKFFEASAN